MQLDFNNTELEKLYTEGKSRRYRLPKNLIKKYIMRINAIRAANTIHDFWADSTLYFERLQGLDDVFSIRINISSRT
jgi:plasmid maintenance system killer protein